MVSLRIDCPTCHTIALVQERYHDTAAKRASDKAWAHAMLAHPSGDVSLDAIEIIDTETDRREYHRV